jgi:hypothetical protein
MKSTGKSATTSIVMPNGEQISTCRKKSEIIEQK